MKFSPLPCYLVPLRPKYFPKHPQPMCDLSQHTPKHSTYSSMAQAHQYTFSATTSTATRMILSSWFTCWLSCRTSYTKSPNYIQNT
jgi:hypothetical protein